MKKLYISKKIPLNLRNFMKKPLILALMIAEGRVGVPLCFRKLVVFNPYDKLFSIHKTVSFVQ